MNGNLFDAITFDYVQSDNQENLFSNSHVKFDITLGYDGRTEHFDYQCNPTYCEVRKEDFFECVLDDAYSYMNFDDIFEFMEEFGYENPKVAKKIYNGCKQNYEKLVNLLGSEDAIEVLNDNMES